MTKKNKKPAPASMDMHAMPSGHMMKDSDMSSKMRANAKKTKKGKKTSKKRVRGGQR